MQLLSILIPINIVAAIIFAAHIIRLKLVGRKISFDIVELFESGPIVFCAFYIVVVIDLASAAVFGIWFTSKIIF